MVAWLAHKIVGAETRNMNICLQGDCRELVGIQDKVVGASPPYIMLIDPDRSS